MICIASWYAHGHMTASGIPFDPREMFAASRTLAIGTLVRLTYHGHTLLATIVDRGPFVHGRTLDVTRAIAEKLGFIRQGVARITCEATAG